MGDVADAMLDGTLCEGCGVFMGDDVGYPRKCDDCARVERADERRRSQPEFAICPICHKRVKTAGLLQHTAAKHASNPEAK